VDGIWQRAFRAHLTEEIKRHPDLPEADFFGKSLTINPDQIKFYFVASPSSLATYLDMIEAAIPQANQTAAEERQRAQKRSLKPSETCETETKRWSRSCRRGPRSNPRRAERGAVAGAVTRSFWLGRSSV